MTSLDGLRALEQAAKPGPWSTRGVTIRQGLGVTEPSYGPIATTYDSEADAEFIAEARNALPGLLGRVAAAEAERDALAKQLDEALSANHDGGYAIIGLQAERDALRTALVVWQERYGRCPLCFRLSQWGHESDCAALVASVPSGPAAGPTTSKETR